MKNQSGLLAMLAILLSTCLTSIQSQTAEFEPSNDAYIETSTRINDDFLRLEDVPGRHRTAYLRFDNITVSGTITKVELKLTISDDHDKKGGVVTVYQGSHSNWTEGALSTSNAPTITGSPLATRNTSTTDSAGNINIYDLSISNTQIYSGSLSLIMKYQNSTSFDEDLSYASNEEPTIAWRPKLIITYTPSDNQDPTAPTLTSTSQSDTTADLSWNGATDNIGVTGYKLYNGTSEIYDGALTNRSVTGLTPNTTYNFSVVAYDAAGNQSLAGAISVTTQNSGSSSSSGLELYTQSNAANPTNESATTTGWVLSNVNGASLTAENTESFTGSHSIKLQASNTGYYNASYEFPTEIGKEYEIKIHAKNASSTYGGFWQWVGFGTTKPSVSITDTNWKEYIFNVTADNTTGKIRIYPADGAVSGDAVYFDNISIIEAGTQSTNLSPPTNLSASTPSGNSTSLSWTASNSSGVTGYKLYRNGNPTTIGNVTSYTINNLSTTATETFKLRSIDANGIESVDSSQITVDNIATSGDGSVNEIGGTGVTSIFYDGVNVGIATNPQSTYRLAVDGKIHTKEVKVDLNGWADYVFFKDYKLPTLQEVEKNIEEKGHLINIPSASEVEANGIELGEMNKLLLEKIEELTLYIISLNKEVSKLKEVQQK